MKKYVDFLIKNVIFSNRYGQDATEMHGMHMDAPEMHRMGCALNNVVIFVKTNRILCDIQIIVAKYVVFLRKTNVICSSGWVAPVMHGMHPKCTE